MASFVAQRGKTQIQQSHVKKTRIQEFYCQQLHYFVSITGGLMLSEIEIQGIQCEIIHL